MSDGLISGKIVSRGLFLLIFEATNGRQEQELHFAPSIVSFTDLPTVGDGDEVFVVEAEAAEVGAELGVALLRPRVARVEQHGQAQRLSTRQTTGRRSTGGPSPPIAFIQCVRTVLQALTEPWHPLVVDCKRIDSNASSETGSRLFPAVPTGFDRLMTAPVGSTGCFSVQSHLV